MLPPWLRKTLTYRQSPSEAAIVLFLTFGYAFMACDVVAIQGIHLRHLGLWAPSQGTVFVVAAGLYVLYLLGRKKLGLLTVFWLLGVILLLTAFTFGTLDRETIQIPIPRFLTQDERDVLTRRLGTPFSEMGTGGGYVLIVRHDDAEAATARAALAELHLKEESLFPPLRPSPSTTVAPAD